MVEDPAQESEESSDRNTAEAGTPPSKGQILRKLVLLKLKLAGVYVLDGFAPVVAVIAVIVAVMAINGNKSGQAGLAQNTARIASLSENLLASKAEVEKLKTALAQEKLSKEDERKKQNEQMATIIQGVSKLQAKMKVSPTLEEQLHQPVAALVLTPPVATVAAVPAKSATVPATAAVITGANKKPGDQGQVLKEAIDKFNKK